MASESVRGRTKSSISVDEAVKQFDLLFDEYFDITQPEQTSVSTSMYATRFVLEGGEDKLESPGCEEIEEVCTDSHSDTEQKETIHQVAKELAKLGDRYTEKFGSDFLRMDSVMTSLFSHKSGLQYQTFCNTMESVMEHDRNAANFMFVMCLSNRVVGKVGNLAVNAKSFFRRYISDNYVTAIADAGGVEQFMGQS